MSEYKCKIATIDEMHIKWDYEISHAGEDRENCLSVSFSHHSPSDRLILTLTEKYVNKFTKTTAV